MLVSIKNITKIILLTLIGGNAFTQDFSENFYLGKDEFVDKIAQNEEYRFQYTISYFKSDTLISTDTGINGLYYYPASSIKLPIAMLVIEKMNELGLEMDDRLIIDPGSNCGNRAYINNSQKAVLTFRKMLQELIVVSDNDHYNAFYHFLSPHYIHERMKDKGFSGVKIFRAFTGCSKEENLFTNSWKVLRGDSLVAIGKKEEFPLDEFLSLYTYDSKKLIGDRHEKDNIIVKGPYDFNYNIEFPLEELHKVTIDLYSRASSWSVNELQRTLLLEWMEQFPKECSSLGYDKRLKMDDHVFKYIFSDIDQSRTSSKIGLSYGFTTETSIFYCGKTTVVVTASIYTNSNKIVNDGEYEYESIARPFLCRFGRLILEQIGECNE